MTTNWKDYLSDPSYQLGMLPGLDLALQALNERIESIQTIRRELPMLGAILPGLEMVRDRVVADITSIRTVLGQKQLAKPPRPQLPFDGEEEQVPPPVKRRKQIRKTAQHRRKSLTKLLSAAVDVQEPQTNGSLSIDEIEALTKPEFVKYAAKQNGGQIDNAGIKNLASRYKKHESLTRGQNLSVTIATAIHRGLVTRVEKGVIEVL